MAGSHPKYPSPLAGFEDAAPLPTNLAEDGDNFLSPPQEGLSGSYKKFTPPLDNGRRGGFDIHIYHFQNNPAHAKHAKELWERIRREFPELRVYRFWEKPVGPHPIAMFEVNLFTPAQFGAFIPWLVMYRGPLSALVHPNTDEEGDEAAIELRNHVERGFWLGEKIPLDLTAFYP
ncbi:hypothetical protein ACHAQH_005580 [Verticillium albo-atrum]